MKKIRMNAFVFAMLINAAFIGGIQLENHYWKKDIKARTKVLDAYRGYVVSTEHLLDLLNHQYNWVDGLDHDGYYESRAEVFHLDSIALSHEQARQEACFKMNEKFNQ